MIAAPEVMDIGDIPMSLQGMAGTSQANKEANLSAQQLLEQAISGSAFEAYEFSYTGYSDSGPLSRATESFSGISVAY